MKNRREIKSEKCFCWYILCITRTSETLQYTNTEYTIFHYNIAMPKLDLVTNKNKNVLLR